MKTSLSLATYALFALLTTATPITHKRATLANVYTTCSVPNTIAITFDDGPWIYQKSISDLFSKAGAKATFFVNGFNFDCIYNADRISDLQYAYAAGHQIASHTWSHGDLANANSAQINDGMYRMDQALSRILGVVPAFVRPPYGSYADSVRAVAATRNQVLAMWNWDTGDADGNTTAQAEAVYDDIVKAKVSAAAVLNHETEEDTATTLIPYAIKLFQSHGYKLVTFAECIGLQPYQAIGLPQVPTNDWTCSGTPAPGQFCTGSQCLSGSVPVFPAPGNSGNLNVNNILIHPTASSSKCLTASSNTNQASVSISDCTSATNQLWSVTTSGAIAIFGGTKCLDVTDGSTAPGTKLQIYDCANGNTNQKWSVSGNKIQWSGKSNCLDNSGGSLTNGNPTQLWTCTGGPNQQWTFSATASSGTSTGSGTVSTGGGSGSNPPPPPPPVTGSTIRPGSSSSSCLTVASNSNNAAVTVQPCNGGASQAWKQSGGSLVIYDNKCLDVPNGNTTPGTKLQVYTCNTGNTNQQFTVTGDNRIAWTNKGECLDLTDGKATAGNLMQLWTCSTGNNNQVWKLV